MTNAMKMTNIIKGQNGQIFEWDELSKSFHILLFGSSYVSRRSAIKGMNEMFAFSLDFSEQPETEQHNVNFFREIDG